MKKEIPANSYVYVYIDPRNFEEFYYGKGKNKRKEAHKKDESDSEKANRIKAIKKAGLEPVVKVIAKGLTEREAFLIEKTLIWKLGRTLTNKSSGHFADKFRPHNTLHKDLAYFDFQNGLYYVNIGQGKRRDWDDCRMYGFLSAGMGRKWSEQIKTLEPGDIVVAYLKRFGFVGIGRVINKAVKVSSFKVNGKSLDKIKLTNRKILENSENDKSEYLTKIKWIKSVDQKDAKWKRKSGLYTTRLIKASLQNQTKTIEFLEKEFKVSFKKLLLTN